MALTARAGLVALAGVLVVLVAPLGGWSVVIVETGVLLGVALDLVLAGGVHPLTFTRTGTATTRQGEPATVTLIVTNAGRRRLRGTVRDAWPPSAGAGPRVHTLDVPPGEQRRLQTVLVPTRRGDRRAVRVSVRSLGPLGLAGRQGGRVVPGVVRVLPAFGSRRFLPERLARLRRLDGAVAARVRGQGSEFDSLRDYVPGDDVRAIDWRATARRDAVVVRTWRPERDRRVVLVLDTGRTSAARVGDVPRLDSSLDAALLLGALAARAGDRIDLLAVDRVRRASVEGASYGEVLPRLVQAITPLEPALVESDASIMVAEVLRRARQRCLVVVFTALDGAEAGLLPVLGSLTSRHLVLLAAVGDPRVSELAAGRGDAEAVYAAGAAERVLADRRRVTALLRRRGVEVVDEPPGTFAPAVADAYLSLKEAGRL
ncbi:MAG: DUF58 domain-containing protein [Actinomycetota bacterium]|nr:DUF58 domain-containing protein [Actinomycetota bacterium]